MYYRRKLLLALIEKSSNQQVSKLALQKLLFLLNQKESKQIYFDFVPYKYGCFSFQANKDLSILCNYYNLIKEKDKSWLLNNDENYFEQLKPYHQEYINNFCNEFKNQQNMLIQYTYDNFPYYTLNSILKLSKKQQEARSLEEDTITKQTEKTLFSIGYEGISIDSYLNSLIKNNIKLLCDVRKNPLSMKYGFSKRTLQAYCQSLDISYIHLPNLGIESQKRQQLNSKEDYDILFGQYKKTLIDKQDDLLRISKLLDQYNRIALTCFEKDKCYCHRSFITEYLENTYNIVVKHL